MFVDATADLDDARRIAVNAKVQRPSVCNAAETLLVHAHAAPAFLPRVLGELREAGVELRVDDRARSLAGALGDSLSEATDEDWATEYLALVLAVKVVDSLEEAIDHVNRFGSGHSEAIVTGSTASAQAFTRAVDAACVYVNASTRFTDGGVFGMGAEIGNSTQKLHARGPIGARELTTYKFVIEGSGQVRTRLPRIGILGGAFNPPHLGHLVCAQEALVAAGAGPRRARARGRGAAPDARGRPRPGGAPSDGRARGGRRPGPQGLADRARPAGPSYTADTLADLREQAPADELTLILGGDQAAALPSWHEPERVLELARVAAVERVDWAREEVVRSLAGLSGADRVTFIHMPLIEISSSDLRRRVSEGEPVRYLVPGPVADYIADRGLYAAGERTGVSP